jgi:hypothetical protein
LPPQQPLRGLRPCRHPRLRIVGKLPRKGEIPTSFKPEVIADSSGKWSGNALRFATREEAKANVQDLMMRWFGTMTEVIAEEAA